MSVQTRQRSEHYLKTHTQIRQFNGTHTHIHTLGEQERRGRGKTQLPPVVIRDHEHRRRSLMIQTAAQIKFPMAISLHTYVGLSHTNSPRETVPSVCLTGWGIEGAVDREVEEKGTGAREEWTGK